MDKIFADTDICLDLLSERKPFYHAAAKIFTLADERKIKLCVSALSFSVLDYLLKQQLNNTQSRQVLLKFKSMISVLTVNEKIIELALASEFTDFEDAIQYYTATDNGIKLILTRNLRDYKKSQIPVITAEGYLQSLKLR